MTNTKTPAPPREVPPLIHNAPSCPVCYQSTHFDGDGWRCSPCRFTWDAHGSDNGERLDGVDRQCPAEVAPYPDHEKEHMRVMRYRCIRNVGHPVGDIGEHHVGMRSDGGVDYCGYPHEWDGDD